MRFHVAILKAGLCLVASALLVATRAHAEETTDPSASAVFGMIEGISNGPRRLAPQPPPADVPVGETPPPDPRVEELLPSAPPSSDSPPVSSKAPPETKAGAPPEPEKASPPTEPATDRWTPYYLGGGSGLGPLRSGGGGPAGEEDEPFAPASGGSAHETATEPIDVKPPPAVSADKPSSKPRPATSIDSMPTTGVADATGASPVDAAGGAPAESFAGAVTVASAGAPPKTSSAAAPSTAAPGSVPSAAASAPSTAVAGWAEKFSSFASVGKAPVVGVIGKVGGKVGEKVGATPSLGPPGAAPQKSSLVPVPAAESQLVTEYDEQASDERTEQGSAIALSAKGSPVAAHDERHAPAPSFDASTSPLAISARALRTNGALPLVALLLFLFAVAWHRWRSVKDFTAFLAALPFRRRKREPPPAWAEIRVVLERCLELAPELRPRYLHVATRGRSELRLAVERLLEKAPAAATGVIAPIVSEALHAASLETDVPASLGGYEVVRRIGGGGMGDVFLASDRGESIVIKKIRRGYSEETQLRRMLESEARLGALLVHRNIVSVRAFIEDAGASYLLMEHIDGKNLGELMEELRASGRSFPLGGALHVASEVCAALSYAHQLDEAVVHRDLSPGNVMISFAGDVKVIDFGVARFGEGTRLTQVGMLRGTVGYLAPEVVAGERADHRSDLFSLALVLYELIAGQPFFRAGSLDEALRLVAEYRSPDDKIDALPVGREVRDVLKKALQRDPAARYESAAELSRALPKSGTGEALGDLMARWYGERERTTFLASKGELCPVR